MKYRFVREKLFSRGLELFGQHSSRLKEPGYREQIQTLGLIVVEGPNDVIALDSLGVPAVGLCSNMITDAQAAKLVRSAKQLSDGHVTLMLDNDHEGSSGSRQVMEHLAPHCYVRSAWPPSAGAKWLGCEPESLTADEWAEIEGRLRG